jgi:hypothetical protein
MEKSLILIWVSQIYGLSQEGFQALVLVAEVLLDLRPRLAFDRFHLLQVRFKNRLSVREHLQEALTVSGTHLPVFANKHVRHIPPPVQIMVFPEEDLHVQTR